MSYLLYQVRSHTEMKAKQPISTSLGSLHQVVNQLVFVLWQLRGKYLDLSLKKTYMS